MLTSMTLTRSPLVVALLSVTVLTGCGGGSTEPGRPIAAEACGFLLDAAKIALANDPPSEDADAMDRAVDKAVKAAHRAYLANPDYQQVLTGAKSTADAVRSGDSQRIATAIKSASASCAQALRPKR